jgi:hypothetical protein
VTPADLRDLLVKRLTVSAGGPARRWREAIGVVRVYPVATHPHCNWSVSASGSAFETATVERLLDVVRGEHPIVEVG